MRTIKGIFGKVLLVSVVALSLAVSAFAHRAMPISGLSGNSQAYPAGLDIEAYRLPDGTLPIFCLNSGDGEGTSGTLKKTCDFCTIAHGVNVSADIVIPLLTSVRDCSTRKIKAKISSSDVFDPGTPSTGPPELS